MTKLNEYSKDEWRDVCRRLKPGWSDEEFEAKWAEFHELEMARLAALARAAYH